MPGALSRTTLVIVLVCAVLAAAVVLVLALNLLRPRTRRPPAPLPPVQPLAHHRVLNYDSLHSRPPSSVPDDPHNAPNPSFSSFDPPPSPLSSLSRPLPPRPLSTASLSSAAHVSRHTSPTNLRGVPHAPTSHVQIVLPTPLSPTLPRPHTMRRVTQSDRMSLVDKWVPVGRDNSAPFCSSRRASASATMSTCASSFTYFKHPFPPPPVPRIPKEVV